MIPALAGAGICLFLQRSGFLGFFFLVPLGFLAFRYEYRTAWKTLLLAITGNAVLSLVLTPLRSIQQQPPPANGVIWDILYFSVLALIFTWVTAPPSGFSEKIPGSMRLMLGSGLGALLFIWIFFQALSTPEFSEYLGSTVNAIVSFYRSSGSDVVQNALLESLTAEMVLEAMKSVMLRGGSLLSCVILFFLGRQISFSLARFTLRDRSPRPGAFAAFHVYPAIIWVLSVSLLLVVVTRMANLEVPEIFLWNILLFCVILYIAQGFGILQFFLARPSVSPFMKFFLNVLFIVLLFSPFINAVLLGGVVLLGIAENWVPLRRVPKPIEPPSTPEADGE